MKKKNIMDFVNKNDLIISDVLLIIIYIIINKKIMIFYEDRISIIDNIISVYGTIFGFILTCLSIFIVFRTDDRYIEEKRNKSALGILLDNNKFNDIYSLF